MVPSRYCRRRRHRQNMFWKNRLLKFNLNPQRVFEWRLISLKKEQIKKAFEVLKRQWYHGSNELITDHFTFILLIKFKLWMKRIESIPIELTCIKLISTKQLSKKRSPIDVPPNYDVHYCAPLIKNLFVEKQYHSLCFFYLFLVDFA